MLGSVYEGLLGSHLRIAGDDPPRGLRPGDKVCLMMRNSAANVEAWLGLCKAGIVQVFKKGEADGGIRVRVSPELQREFSLHHTLSLYVHNTPGVHVRVALVERVVHVARHGQQTDRGQRRQALPRGQGQQHHLLKFSKRGYFHNDGICFTFANIPRVS